MVDVRDETSVERAVEAAVRRFGGIDILINNASAISLTGTLVSDSNPASCSDYGMDFRTRR